MRLDCVEERTGLTSQSETKITNLEKWINHLHLTWKRRASKIPFFVDDWTEAISNGVPPSPVTVWECYFEAGLCFLNGGFAASLMASSASVEAGINLDSRMQDFRQRGKPNLTIDVLKEAKKRGLPIDKLLIQGDDLEENVQFIDNRNKFDHGDFYLPTNTMSAGPLLVKLKKSDKKDNSKMVFGFSQYPETLPQIQLQLAHSFLTVLYGNWKFTEGVNNR